MVFIRHNFLKLDIFFNPIFIPHFLGSRFFRVQVFQGPSFSRSIFFRVQVFLDPDFSGSVSRVLVKALEVAVVIDYFLYGLFYRKILELI